MSQVEAVVCRGLRKRYGSTVALADADVAVQRGSRTALLGPNGAGKSTLLRALLGLVRLDGGTISFGERSDGAQHDAGRGCRIGAVLEQPRFYPWLTGAQHVGVWAPCIVSPTEQSGIFDRLDLSPALGRKVRGYSQGMRQRLALGLALLTKPDILLLDEPTNGLDPAGIDDFRTLVRELSATGMTVLYSTHLVAEAERTCDAVAVLVGGRVRASGPIQSLRAGQRAHVVRVRMGAEREAVTRLAHYGAVVARAGEVRVPVTAVAIDVLETELEGLGLLDVTSSDASLEEIYFGLTRAAASS